MSNTDTAARSSGETGLLARLSSLMDEVLALSNTERSAFCDALENTEPEVASKLRGLLRSHDEAERLGFLESTISPDAVLLSSWDKAVTVRPKRTGYSLGPYRLVRQIGEGGMSAVWLAERDYGHFVRQVALKCLPAIFNKPEFRDRLLREAAILSPLSHPGIAQLLDAGVAEDGEPYIALELIDGEPITAYCDRLKLDVKARVRLMAAVCEAVAFLHSHSVVHRDIKPSNVLVDKSGNVKLLDFGIAKMIRDELQAMSEVTRHSNAAFTPEYAAPEQVSGAPITTATDIYSLGVLLYRLLTGSRPYARGAAPFVVTSAILNTMPSRPSTLFGPAGGIAHEELERIANERQSSVKQLHLGLRNDLDNILLKCLEKEGSRRYSTVDALRTDLFAHLESRPVLAQPPSTLYVTRKFVARHRGSVAASALTLVAVVAALAFGAWQARQTHVEAVKTKRVLMFLQSLIAEASPNSTGVETITVLDLLKRAPDVARKQFPESAELQFEVLKPVEQILRDLEAAEALEPVEAAMVKLLSATSSLAVEEEAELRGEYAMTLAYLGKHDLADAALAHAIQRLEAANKKNTAVYAQTLMRKSKLMVHRREMADAADLAIQSHDRLVNIAPQENSRLTQSAFDATSTLLAAGRLAEAAAIADKHLTLERIAAVSNAKERLQYRMVYAALVSSLGNPSTAEQQYDVLLDESKRFFGENNAVYPTLLLLAARACAESGAYEKALRLFAESEALERKAKKVNKRSLVSILSQTAIAHLHVYHIQNARDKLAQSDALIQQGEPASSTYWQARYQLALLENELDRAGVALDNQEAALPRGTAADSLARAMITLDRASLLDLSGMHDRAIEATSAAIVNLLKHVPASHPRVLKAELRLAQALAAAGSTQEALARAASVHTRVGATLGLQHPLALQSQFILGGLEEKAGKAEGAPRAEAASKHYQARFHRPLRLPLARLH